MSYFRSLLALFVGHAFLVIVFMLYLSCRLIYGECHFISLLIHFCLVICMLPIVGKFEGYRLFKFQVSPKFTLADGLYIVINFSKFFGFIEDWLENETRACTT